MLARLRPLTNEQGFWYNVRRKVNDTLTQKEKAMAKYLDPKADVTFKKVFGEHKNLVISLLNALLPLDDGKQVESIE